MPDILRIARGRCLRRSHSKYLLDVAAIGKGDRRTSEHDERLRTTGKRHVRREVAEPAIRSAHDPQDVRAQDQRKALRQHIGLRQLHHGGGSDVAEPTKTSWIFRHRASQIVAYRDGNVVFASMYEVHSKTLADRGEREIAIADVDYGARLETILVSAGIAGHQHTGHAECNPPLRQVRD